MRELELIGRDCSYSCSNKITTKKVKFGKKKKAITLQKLTQVAHFFVLEESSIFGKARGPQIRARK